MKTMNKIELIGYLGNDPIVTTTSSGAKRAVLRLATDSFSSDQSGNKIRKACWHDVVAWDKLAETIKNQYLKGSHIRVEGNIQYHTYSDKTGHTRYITIIRALRLMNLDR